MVCGSLGSAHGTRACCYHMSWVDDGRPELPAHGELCAKAGATGRMVLGLDAGCVPTAQVVEARQTIRGRCDERCPCTRRGGIQCLGPRRWVAVRPASDGRFKSGDNGLSWQSAPWMSRLVPLWPRSSPGVHCTANTIVANRIGISVRPGKADALRTMVRDLEGPPKLLPWIGHTVKSSSPSPGGSDNMSLTVFGKLMEELRVRTPSTFFIVIGTGTHGTYGRAAEYVSRIRSQGRYNRVVPFVDGPDGEPAGETRANIGQPLARGPALTRTRNYGSVLSSGLTDDPSASRSYHGDAVVCGSDLSCELRHVTSRRPRVDAWTTAIVPRTLKSRSWRSRILHVPFPSPLPVPVSVPSFLCKHEQTSRHNLDSRF